MKYVVGLILGMLAGVSIAAAAVDAGRLDELRSKLSTFNDISMSVEVVYKDKKVLDTMDERLRRAYEFSKAKIWFKMPYSTVIEGTIGVLKAKLITTDKLFILRVPSLRFSKKEDISNDPTKRQTALDLGILTPQAFTDDRADLLPDDPKHPGLLVIDLIPPKKGSSIRRIWVDPKEVRLVQMEKRRPNGRVLGTFVYMNHEKFADKLWVPKRVEVRSPEGKLAAALEAKDIKVDSGLSDDLFE